MNFNKYIICCIILIALTSTGIQSFAQHLTVPGSYYVSLTGNNNNPGTRKSPFKTLDKINSLHLKAGDTVYFKSGEIFNGSLLFTQTINGAINKPVVITSYGKGHATINAKDSVGIKVYKGSYVKLQHLTLVGSGRKTGNVKDGVAID